MWYPVFLVAVILVYFVMTLPVVKGFIGELIVRFVLKFLDKRRFRVFNDVYFPAYNGLFMQIDHLVIGRGVVFVIETKNYNGIIEGDWRRKYWTVRKKGHHAKVYNPMRQSSYHVRMLKENKIVPDIVRIYPIVCLGPLAKPEVIGRIPVVTPQKLSGCIRKIAGDEKRKGEITVTWQDLQNKMLTGRKIKGEHIRKLGLISHRKKEGICPRCGGRLFYRNSMRGRIAICTNYPWCKYRNLSQNLKQ